MGTKYRTKSADVLNEADRYERILNHRLFAMEQDNQLWGYREDVSWIPGDFIYPHPGGNYSVCDEPDCDPSRARRFDDPNLRNCNHRRYHYWADDALESYSGNTPRYLIDVLDDRNVHTVRCKPCQVYWVGNDPCFSCGETTRGINGPDMTPAINRSYQEILYYSTAPASEAVFNLQRAIFDMVEALYGSPMVVHSRRTVNTPNLRGPRPLMTFVEEPWGVRLPAEPYVYTPVANPFHRDVPERLVLPCATESAAEPLVDDPLAPVGGVQWRSRRTSISLPPMTAEQLGPQTPIIHEPEMEPLPELPTHPANLYPTSNDNIGRRR